MTRSMRSLILSLFFIIILLTPSSFTLSLSLSLSPESLLFPLFRFGFVNK